MSSLPWIVLAVIYYMESALGLSLNFCIIILNGKSLSNGTTPNPPSVIQLIMGGINMTMRGLMVTQFTALVFPNLRFMILSYIMLALLPFQMYVSNWLISWLCAYYCVSIVHVPSPFFIGVRRRLSSWLPCILILLGAGCIALSNPPLWTPSMTVYSMENSTFLYNDFMSPAPYVVTSIFLAFCTPLIISFISLLTTVMSLVKHVWNIKHRGSGFSPQQIRVHVNAIRTMILLLLLSILFYISEMTLFQLFLTKGIVTVICWIVITVFPTLEAIIIIQSSSRLTKIILGRLCLWRGVEDEH